MALRLSRLCPLLSFRMPKEREQPYPPLQPGLPEARVRAWEVVAGSRRKWRQVARFFRPSPPHVPSSRVVIGQLRFVRGRRAPLGACAAGLCLRVRAPRCRRRVCSGFLLFGRIPTGSVAERAMWSLRVVCRNAALRLESSRAVFPAFPLCPSLGPAVACRAPRGGCCPGGSASW